MRNTKKLLSLLIALIMIITALPFNGILAIASAIDKPVTITVESNSALPGATVDVNVIIKDNPGVLGASITINNSDEITLIDAKSGPAFEMLSFAKPGEYSNRNTFVWDGETISESDIKDGVILTLTYKIADNAYVDTKFPVTVECEYGDIIDVDLNPVETNIVNGNITVIDYTPGDVNQDGKITTTDVVFIRRYMTGGYTLATFNENAADVNADGKINTTDIVMIRRYIVDGCKTDPEGYNITLKPSTSRHIHNMEATERMEATCTAEGNIAYWQCTECGKYYSDAKGLREISLSDTIIIAEHELEHINYKAPTTTEEGNIEYWICKNCLKCFSNSTASTDSEISYEDVVLEKINRDESTVVYNLYGSDSYLESMGVYNPNPASFVAEEGLVLNDLVAPEGYTFKGWSTAGGTSIESIAPGSARRIVLNAVWSKTNYTITFYSPIAPRDSIIRTIDQSVSVSDPSELTKYKFMGWTDEDGNIVTMVKPGTKDITLYANWISYRNQTICNDYLSKGPIEINDEENNQYLFVYDIGKIINVPLYTIKDFGNTTSGIIRTESDSVTKSISGTTAKTITDTVANSTTNSATWTLAKDWNELVTNTEQFSEKDLKENSILISDGYAHTSGSTTNTGTVTDTGTLGKDSTQTKDLTTTKKGSSAEGSVDVKIGKNVSPVNVDIKAKYENHKDTTTEGGTVSSDGTDTYNLTHTNNLNSSSNSNTTSHDETTSEKIAHEASKTWGYSISKSSGGSSSTSENSSNTQSSTNTYSTTFSYTTSETTTNVKEYSTSSAAAGWHRLVCAGTVHVFAVVGFDIATHTYFYYTYSVLDDNTSEFYDYSATDGEYNDYETGVLPFEVPISIHKKVSNKIYMTNGLIIDDQTGKIVEYTGDSEYVNIPDYYSRDNGDGTFDVIKIVGFDSDVFSNNTEIKEVRLSSYITEIPDNAFSGCTSLEYITYDKITSIGNNAFNECSSLNKFVVDTTVTTLGTNAFTDVKEVEINASNSMVATNGAASGAVKETINLRMSPEDLADATLSTYSTTKEFSVNGFKNSYNNLKIVSNADSTSINGITFVSNSDIPMTINSERLTLTNVNVIDASGLTMLLKSNTTEIIVDGANTLSTLGDNAVLCKNISVNKVPTSSVKCSLQVITGNVNIAGSRLTDTDLKYLIADDSRIIYITEQEYDNMLNSHYLYFNAVGGVVDNPYKIVMWNSSYGELPIPTKSYYDFIGWYTEPEGGEKVTSDTILTTVDDVTIYAHWQIHPIEGWVKIQDLPADAMVVDTKWTYDLTTRTTSNSSSIPEGYTQYQDPTWVWGEYGAWSSWSKTSASSSDSRKVETKTVTDQAGYTNYRYWIYRTSDGWGYGTKGYNTGSHGTCTIYDEINLTYSLPVYNSSLGTYGPYNSSKFSHSGDSYWFFGESKWVPAVTHTEYRYADRSKIYTYYYQKIETKEAAIDPTGQSDVSNVQEWVQYRVK